MTDFSESKASVGGQVIELPVLYGGEVDLDPNAPHYDGWDGRETAPDREDVLAHETVSYTHLDVYKRQGFHYPQHRGGRVSS